MNGENCLAAGKCEDCVVNISGDVIDVSVISFKRANVSENVEQVSTIPGRIGTDYLPISFRGFIDNRFKDFLNAEKLRILFTENKANGFH